MPYFVARLRRYDHSNRPGVPYVVIGDDWDALPNAASVEVLMSAFEQEGTLLSATEAAEAASYLEDL